MNRSLARTLAVLLLVAGSGGHALAIAEEGEEAATPCPASYYDFWPGAWHEVVDGEVAPEPRFEVRGNLHPSSFEETWHMDGYRAKAWRVWDRTAERWMFVWISEEGHFQIWEEKKLGEHWYMFKQFVIDGETVLSRQAFIPREDGSVVRTSEHSRDGGESWRLRFREVLVKVP